ncbi:hypothetical protein K3495_g839 [Podosphaera aphanis]|nr:hypothetical protein K3495_g839 [Podosphaera aphanis]
MPRQSVTIEQRRALRQWRKSQTEPVTQKACIEWFSREFNHDISQSTVSESLSSKYSYLDEASLTLVDDQARNRAGLYDDLETLLSKWQFGSETQGNTVTSENIRQKARLIWQQLPRYQGKPCPQFSNRWVEGYKKRNQVRARARQNTSTPNSTEDASSKIEEDSTSKTPGDAGPKSTLDGASVGTKDDIVMSIENNTPKTVEDSTPKGTEGGTISSTDNDTVMTCEIETSKVSENNNEIFQNFTKEYNAEQIYNMTETVLFWRMTPSSNYSSQSSVNIEIEKSRISLIVCTNATGTDRIPIWCIGKHKSPPSLHNINVSTMGGEWRSNTRARMCKSIMSEWLEMFYRHIDGKRALLLLDNFSTFSSDPNLCLPPSNIRICWFPPNFSNLFRPLSQGIIQNLKAHYRQSWLEYMIELLDQGIDPLKTMNIRLALRWIFRSWYTDLRDSSIYSCFRKSTLISSDASPELPTQIPDLRSLFQRISSHFNDMISLNHFLNPYEENIVDTNENNPNKDENAISGGTMDDNSANQIAENGMIVDEIITVPVYSILDAKRALRVLQGFSESNSCIDTTLIRSLELFEQRLKAAQPSVTHDI